MDVQDWLQQSLRSYANTSKTFYDIEACIKQYPSLVLKQEQYTDDRGVTRLLVCMVGTIPVLFRGYRYNIPVRVWIPLSYPQETPIVYVEPTSSMGIRAGSFVLADGRVYSPCQQSWGYSLPAHEMTLGFLLGHLCEIFANEPPVYSKPSTSPVPAHIPTHIPSHMPTQAPAHVPLPSAMPTSGQSQYHSGFVYAQHPLVNQPVIYGTSITSMPTPPVVQPPPPMQSQPFQQPQQTNYYAPNPTYSQTPTPVSTASDTDNHLRSDLLEKISTNIAMAKKEFECEAKTWAEKRDKLEYHRVEIDSVLAITAQETQELHRLAASLKTQSAGLRSFLDMDAARIENLDTDSYADLLLEDKNPDNARIKRQKESITHEIHAMDDTIYQLSQLLYQKNMDLNLFLRNVRMLARQVFLNKALLLKCESMTQQ